MTDLQALQTRILLLEDAEAIRRLKARYFYSIDLKRWDQLRDCFSVDAVWDSIKWKIRLEGVEAIVRFIQDVEGGDHVVNTHHGLDPEIEITGATTATGFWGLTRYREDSKRPVPPRTRIVPVGRQNAAYQVAVSWRTRCAEKPASADRRTVRPAAGGVRRVGVAPGAASREWREGVHYLRHAGGHVAAEFPSQRVRSDGVDCPRTSTPQTTRTAAPRSARRWGRCDAWLASSRGCNTLTRRASRRASGCRSWRPARRAGW